MSDADVDQLYGLPLDEFVAARNALAKSRKEPALRKLRKPSVAAWHVDQLARSHAPLVQALVDAGAGVRQAQQRALAGARGGGDELRSASAAHRSAVDALVDALPSDASPSTAERVRSTLMSASLDESAVDDLVAGRLVDEVEASGFGDLAGLDVFAGALADEGDGDGDEEPEPEPDPHAEERARLQSELAVAKAALDDAKDREAKARAALDRAYDAARDAERAVADLESHLREVTP
jgi:hypothetical protein